MLQYKVPRSVAGVALAALDTEMDFVWQLGKSHATQKLLDLHRSR